MRLEQLDYLIAVKKYHSMNKAAEAVFVSQQAISKSIKELEVELGIALVYRNNKGSFLTTEALKLVDAIQDFYAVCEQVKRKEITTSIEDLHILLECSGEILWNSIYSYFANKNITVDLKRDYVDFSNLGEKLNLFPEAIAIMYCDEELYSNLKDKYNIQLVQTFHLAAYVPANSPIANYKEISIKSIRNMEILLYASNENFSSSINICRRYNLKAQNNKFRYHMTPMLLAHEVANKSNIVFFAPAHCNETEFPVCVNLKENIPLYLCCISKRKDFPKELIDILKII